MQPFGVPVPQGSSVGFVFIRFLTKPEYHHTMKNIILLVIVAVGALSLGACKSKECHKSECAACTK